MSASPLPNTTPCEDREAPLAPTHRLLRAAVLVRRAAACAAEVHRLLSEARLQIRAAMAGTADGAAFNALHTMLIICDLRKTDMRAATEHLPVLADALGRHVMPRQAPGSEAEAASQGGAL